MNDETKHNESAHRQTLNYLSKPVPWAILHALTDRASEHREWITSGEVFDFVQGFTTCTSVSVNVALRKYESLNIAERKRTGHTTWWRLKDIKPIRQAKIYLDILTDWRAEAAD